MSEVFDDIIDRETDVARIAAVVASDFRFAYFGTGAFAVRLLRLDQKLADGSDEPAPHAERVHCDARTAACWSLSHASASWCRARTACYDGQNGNCCL
jgi:hypothetical protein